MNANKNSPRQDGEKTRQEHSYRLSFLATGFQYNLSDNHNRLSTGNSAPQKDVSMSDESLDRLVQTPANNESYRHVSKTHGNRDRSYMTPPTHQRKSYLTCLGSEYDLSQPIWFYMIMKKLVGGKEKKK